MSIKLFISEIQSLKVNSAIFDCERPLGDTVYIWNSSSGENGAVEYKAEKTKRKKVARIIQHQNVSSFTGQPYNRIIDGHITNIKQYPFFAALWLGMDRAQSCLCSKFYQNLSSNKLTNIVVVAGSIQNRRYCFQIAIFSPESRVSG